MILYHTGFAEIRKPDIHYGRRNADFGQGFYLTGDRAFAQRWARERGGQTTILNQYELTTEGLRIREFDRDADWFDYIYANRNGRPDSLAEYDLIIGPIANDTIYDTLGITTSGFLSREESLKLLLIGPAYRQFAVKTDKAVSQLVWTGAEILSSETVAGYRGTVLREEAEYQELFAAVLEQIVSEKE
ncbi:MAG: DUF3990 domain-containing protein [Firmicutes bacterium]|nr:DUF3990 domain-containing protein [Bacillota bacterium]